MTAIKDEKICLRNGCVTCVVPSTGTQCYSYAVLLPVCLCRGALVTLLVITQQGEGGDTASVGSLHSVGDMFLDLNENLNVSELYQ